MGATDARKPGPPAGLAALTDGVGHAGDPFEMAGASGLVDHHIRAKAR